jgi:WhiB family redox-sensing transcriptional regulator
MTVKDTGLLYAVYTAAGAEHWRCAAACRHADPELFFPEGTAGPALRQTDQAKQVCMTCPVRGACLSWALRHGVEFGVWGGKDPEQRRAMRAALIGHVPAMRAKP